MSIVFDDHDQFGVYLWQMPDGSVVADEDRNFLSIASMYGDNARMEKLRNAAAQCGVFEGKPLFMPGHRKVTDEEYQEQQARLESGLIPDEYDIGAWKEELDSRR
jgi:hypothetical protein